MAKPIVWKNVAVDMQSTQGVLKNITAITKASTAVATSAGHGLANGDIIFLEVQGMRQLNEKAVRVAGVTTDTFKLEGVDSTRFDDFVSGTAAKVTLGHPITTATTISSSGGNFDFIDTTTIHDNAKSQIPGLPSATDFTMEHIFDPTDPGLLALKDASDNQERRVFRFRFGSSGKILLFAGHVGCSLLPGGQAQQLVTAQSTMTINGTPTYYSA